MSLILDTKDKKILTQLDINARQPNAKIAKKVRLSKEVVKYRIDKLLENGTILRFHTVVNYFKLDILKFKLYVRLHNINKSQLEEIASYFSKHKKTEWVAITTGRWDLIVGFLVNNVNELDDELLKFSTLFSKHIQEKAVTTTLYLAHQTRNYFTPKDASKENVTFHTTKDKKIEIDEKERDLLELVSNNARLPIVKMSQILQTSPRITQYTLKQLEQKKVILAYKAHINPHLLNKIFCKAIIYLNSTSKQRVDSFISYASSLEGAIWPQKVIGAWDFELDFELENYDAFQEILLKLKENFPDIIRNYEFCIVSKELKLDLFPNAKPALNI